MTIFGAQPGTSSCKQRVSLGRVLEFRKEWTLLCCWKSNKTLFCSNCLFSKGSSFASVIRACTGNIFVFVFIPLYSFVSKRFFCTCVKNKENKTTEFYSKYQNQHSCTHKGFVLEFQSCRRYMTFPCRCAVKPNITDKQTLSKTIHPWIYWLISPILNGLSTQKT